MSIERRNLLKAYGAELVLTDGAKGMSGAIDKANELCVRFHMLYSRQFTNPAIPIHRKTTGPEIWEDTDGRLDFLFQCRHRRTKPVPANT